MSDKVIPITTAKSARDAALAPGALARAAHGGGLVRLRRGAYAATEDVTGIDDPSRHRLLVRAARLAATGEPVFSHESAAALHGIPLIGDWPKSAHTTVPFGGGTEGPVVRTQRRLGADDVVAFEDGTLATSPMRTAIDLAAGRSLLGGIVAMSHVRNSGVTEAEIQAGLDAIGPVNGRRRARLALARSTAGSESALETLVVARCQDYGFEPPEQQRAIVGVDGREYRVDFAWRAGRVLGEADGKGKYFDPRLRGDRSPAEVLWAEKRREEELRTVCDRFVRFDWADAWGGIGLARRLDAVGVPRSGRRLCALTF